MGEYFYKDIWRMDWGLGNPNMTAALIATLMVAVWSLVLIRKWGFWVALTLFTGLGVCLIHTFSRGGMIALFAGLAPLIWMAPRPWPRRRLLALGGAIWVMIGFSVYLDAYERFGQGVKSEDRSITNRLELWKTGPRMMVDAPTGWGLGNSGKSYMQWYQPLERTERYRTFVNSHLTWLIEFGWPLRFLYVFAWLAALFLCLPDVRARWLSIPLGIWSAFAVAAFFSSVAESFWLWIVPGLALLCVVAYRIRSGDWPGPSAWGFPLGAALVILLILAGLGGHVRTVQGSKDFVVIGPGEPQLWLVLDSKVIGQDYGRDLRSYFSGASTFPTIAVVKKISDIDDATNDTVVISGGFSEKDKAKWKELLPSVKKLKLVNPTVYPQELEGEFSDKIEILAGEFSQSSSVIAWNTVAPVRRLEGVGDFLPDWTEVLLKEYR